MSGGSVATIGIFDGLHKGHKAIIKKTVQIAKQKRLASIAITFDRHPSSTLKSQHTRLLIGSYEKIKQIKKLGINQVIVIEFDRQFSQLSPRQFVDKVLLPLNVSHIVVGEKFRFGRDRRGDLKFLASYGRRHGIDLTIQPLLRAGPSVRTGRAGREKISSSRIRSLLKQGKIKEVSEMLGRFPTFKGHVVPGKARGKRLGFPSANLRLDEMLCLPKIGVYGGYVKVDSKRKKCLINWGYAPTFGKRDRPVLEVHCLDLDQDLYNKQVEVEIRLHLRGEISFSNKEALARQLKRDAKKVKDMLR